MEFTERQKVLASVVLYCFCSGTLVLLNKLTLFYLPFPSLVVAFQLFVCLALVYGANALGQITVDPIEWENVKPYLVYTLFFSTGVYCNMRSLTMANVETVIVFRALCPLLVTFMDRLCLGREWPSVRSWSGLLLIVIGAYGYASYDEKFQNQGYSAYYWPTAYCIIIALEMAYGKKIVKSVPLKTLSGPVIYTNLLGFVPMLLLANVGGEYSKLSDFMTTTGIPIASIPYLVLGCLVGTGIGYTGWWCRGLVSATSFTILGVMNKCLTILLNVIIWDQHAQLGGILCLLLCVGGGILYQQAPMRADASPSEGLSPTEVEEKESLIEIGSAPAEKGSNLEGSG